MVNPNNIDNIPALTTSLTENLYEKTIRNIIKIELLHYSLSFQSLLSTGLLLDLKIISSMRFEAESEGKNKSLYTVFKISKEIITPKMHHPIFSKSAFTSFAITATKDNKINKIS